EDDATSGSHERAELFRVERPFGVNDEERVGSIEVVQAQARRDDDALGAELVLRERGELREALPVVALRVERLVRRVGTRWGRGPTDQRNRCRRGRAGSEPEQEHERAEEGEAGYYGEGEDCPARRGAARPMSKP